MTKFDYATRAGMARIGNALTGTAARRWNKVSHRVSRG